MKILYINNDGAGFADYVEAETGTTVGDFFAARSKGRAADYLIRVNRQPVAQDYVLQEGDRVSITPTKIEGALAGVQSIATGKHHEGKKDQTVAQPRSGSQPNR